jgi:DNA helicase-2/ATP-dependent DNA helicase PcrA
LKSESSKNSMSVAEYLIEESNEQSNSKVQKFAELMQLMNNRKKDLTIVDLINFVIDRTGYIDMLSDGTVENESRIENIKELITVAAKFDNLDPEEGLSAFLDEVSLLEGASNNEEIQDAVTLMTIHASKGLEFRHVFVVGMEENLFPHSNSMFDDKQLEEERRLAYVAITRAMQKLYITHAKSRLYFGRTSSNPVSRFVNDIDSALIDHIAPEPSDRLDTKSNYSVDSNETYSMNVNLSIGDKVKHEYFGVGTVKYLDDEMIVVNFGSIYGEKELMLEYARLQKV